MSQNLYSAAAMIGAVWVNHVCVYDLRPSQQFFQSWIGDFLSSWVELVLSSGKSVLLNDTTEWLGESHTRHPSIPSLTLYQLSDCAPQEVMMT